MRDGPIVKASDHRHVGGHDDARPSREEPPLPPRATAIFLGVWMVALILIAFFVVPALFASCVPQS